MNQAARVLLLIFGILLIAMGVILFVTPGFNTLALAYVVCVLMLVYGISEIVYYATHHKTESVSGWALADGIITTLLGLMLLFMPGAQILATSMFFTMWVMFTGVTRISAAMSLKDAQVGSWGWMLAAGIIGVLLGFMMMFNPISAVLTIGFIVPLVLVIQGISAVSLFFNSSGKD